MYEEKITIPFSERERVEGLLSYPETLGDRRAVLLCSPHPHFAGNMDNNVIRSLYSFFAGKNLPVLRFNYRGVGGSMIDLPGELSIFNYWENVEEKREYAKTIEDTRTCLGYLARIDRSLKITVIGYSFGAIMAMLTGTDSPEADCLICIAPPLDEYDFTLIKDTGKRTYFIGSSGDFVYDKEGFLSFCSGFSPLKDYRFYDDCDHFFRGKEDELAGTVWRFMDGGLS